MKGVIIMFKKKGSKSVGCYCAIPENLKVIQTFTPEILLADMIQD